MTTQFAYTRKRSEYGRQCVFVHQPTTVTCSIEPDEDEYAKFEPVDPVDQSTQSGVLLAEHHANTETIGRKSVGINHVEGGWPKDLNSEDIEVTARYRKKLEKDEAYMMSVISLGGLMENCIKQNNAIDVYERFFENEDPCSDLQSTSIKTLNCYYDPQSDRAVSSLNWSPANVSNQIVASYLNRDGHISTSDSGSNSYVWDVENPEEPCAVLIPPDDLVVSKFSINDANFIVGGTRRGRVCCFDLRKDSSPIEVSNLKYSHSASVNSLNWINSKSGTELFTSSRDGIVKWWDTRKLNQPLDTLVMDISRSEDPAVEHSPIGVTSLEYESTIPTKFMAGTEQGHVIICNRKGKTQAEKIANVYDCHLGPILHVERNPLFVKNFLTIGLWAFRVWSEDCKESTLSSYACGKVSLTNGLWSTGRPSIFFVTKSDGTLDIWDIIYQQRKPIYSCSLSEKNLQSIATNESAELLVTGCSGGTISLLRLSENLYRSDKSDKQALNAIFERETRREKLLEAKYREYKLHEKNQEVGKYDGNNVGENSYVLHAEIEDVEKENIAEAQTNFYENVHLFKEKQVDCQRQLLLKKGMNIDIEMPRYLDLSADQVEDHLSISSLSQIEFDLSLMKFSNFESLDEVREMDGTTIADESQITGLTDSQRERHLFDEQAGMLANDPSAAIGSVHASKVD